MDDIKIFPGSASQRFTHAVAKHLGVDVGKCETLSFSDGNTFVRINETVRGKDVFLVQSIALRPNDEFVEALFYLDAFKRASAASVTLIMPYFGYAKGDKKDEPRVSIRGRVCAESLELAGADRVVALDLHSPQIQGFFKKPVDHLYALPVFVEYLKKLQLKNPVLVSPDTGFIKQARLYSEVLGWPMAIGDKIRRDHSEQAKILEIIGDVKDKEAVIVDDFAISGGTLLELANELQKRGTQRIIAVLTHILMNPKGLQRLEASPIEELLVSDSVENPHLSLSSKVRVLSVAPLFASAIKKIFHRESLAKLFDEPPSS